MILNSISATQRSLVVFLPSLLHAGALLFFGPWRRKSKNRICKRMLQGLEEEVWPHHQGLTGKVFLCMLQQLHGWLQRANYCRRWHRNIPLTQWGITSIILFQLSKRVLLLLIEFNIAKCALLIVQTT